VSASDGHLYREGFVTKEYIFIQILSKMYVNKLMRKTN